MNKIPKYTIGTIFTRRGKHKTPETIVDILTTTNNAGNIVKIRYVTSHDFCGQTIKDSDVTETTIAMGNIQY